MAKPDALVDRMKHLLSTGKDAADVRFSVGEGDKKETLPAHTQILLAASDVFEKMFLFDAQNAKAAAAGGKEIKAVEVPDVEVGAFKAMLSFIYADDLSGISKDNVFDVLYAAYKYNVPGLIKACVNFPKGKLSNIFHSIEEARVLGETLAPLLDFASNCLDYIDKNAANLLLSKEFLQIDQKLLCEILDRDQLIVEELTIWNAALRWADEQCDQHGKERSAENRREMLGPALFKICFPLIPQKDFSTNIVLSRVLTSDQMMGVFQHYSHPDAEQPGQYPLQFPTKRRTSSDPYKAKGKIVLKIEKVSEFTRENNGRRLSEAVYIRGLPWKIVVIQRPTDFGFYVRCNDENTVQLELCRFDNIWNCFANEGKKDHTREISRHIFNLKENSWGFSYFMEFEELMDPRNGWYDVKNDTVILSVEVTAEEPIGIE